MSGASEEHLAAKQRGWHSDSTDVCSECVLEPSLKRTVAAAEQRDRSCDFCRRSPASDIDILSAATVAGFRNEYRPVEQENVPWDRGYQGVSRFFSTAELVTWEFDELFTEPLVTKMIENLTEEDWIPKDSWSRRRDEVLKDSWDAFGAVVSWADREQYWSTVDAEPYAGGEVRPTALLSSISDTLDALGLVNALPPGFRVWRGRPDEPGSDAWDAQEIGTPPNSYAKENRMSPAGRGLFYGSDTQKNAVDEIHHYTSGKIMLGEFQLDSALPTVDLTKLPAVPSPFDSQLGEYRRDIVFLHKFVDSISAPVAPGTPGVYERTQVIADFLFHAPAGPRVGAIRYVSSLSPTDTVTALDMPNEACFSSRQPSASSPPRLQLLRKVEA